MATLRYYHDALDQLDRQMLPGQQVMQHFYKNGRRVTALASTQHRSLFQHEHRLLAAQRGLGTQASTALLRVDGQQSLLGTSASMATLAHQPYGFQLTAPEAADLPGFNGELREPVTGHYLLGNGYRAYSPLLMRFNRPDSWSPFGKGGLNAYGYCLGDPVNASDPSGHSAMSDFIELVGRVLSGRRIINAVSDEAINGRGWRSWVERPPYPGRRPSDTSVTVSIGSDRPPAYTRTSDQTIEGGLPPRYPIPARPAAPPRDPRLQELLARQTQLVRERSILQASGSRDVPRVQQELDRLRREVFNIRAAQTRANELRSGAVGSAEKFRPGP